ncbi:MAG: hypothetical protein AB4372_39215 [Xenococcus sp. (in: cyanobacteria)]
MKKLNRIFFISLASMGLLASVLPAILSPKQAVAQSQFDCYMITESGQRIDLSRICDASQRNRLNRSQRVVQEEGDDIEANAVNNVPIQVINNSFPRSYRKRTRIYSGISPYPYRVIPNLGPASNRFLSSLTGEYNYRQNRILGPISDPYFSGSPAIIYRYQK